MKIREASELSRDVVSELGKAIVGQQDVLKEVVVALLAGGHAVIEGVPGTAKTLIARTLACVTGADFRRIQFTPDLMPADIVGVYMFNRKKSEFEFRAGPIFSDIILADEINRAPAKTQSALLEAMEEGQATVDGVPHALSDVYTVFATQNPIEYEGTYPLPEAQLDRFMLKIKVDYPEQELESQILDRVHEGFDAWDPETAGVEPVLDVSTLSELREAVGNVHVEKMVRRYVTRIVRETRTRQDITLGASPRAGVMLMRAAKAQAVLDGRDYATPDDAKSMAFPVLRHRLSLLPEVEIEGKEPDDCIEAILSDVEVPR